MLSIIWHPVISCWPSDGVLCFCIINNPAEGVLYFCVLSTRGSSVFLCVVHQKEFRISACCPPEGVLYSVCCSPEGVLYSACCRPEGVLYFCVLSTSRSSVCYPPAGVLYFCVLSTRRSYVFLCLLHQREFCISVCCPPEGVLYFCVFSTRRSSVFLCLVHQREFCISVCCPPGGILYFCDAGTHAIESVSTSGGNRQVIFRDNSAHFFDLFLTDRYIYYSDWRRRWVPIDVTFSSKTTVSVTRNVYQRWVPTDITFSLKDYGVYYTECHQRWAPIDYCSSECYQRWAPTDVTFSSKTLTVTIIQRWVLYWVPLSVTRNVTSECLPRNVTKGERPLA